MMHQRLDELSRGSSQDRIADPYQTLPANSGNAPNSNQRPIRLSRQQQHRQGSKQQSLRQGESRESARGLAGYQEVLKSNGEIE